MSEPAFNRVLTRFAEDLERPAYRAKRDAIRGVAARYESQGRPLRWDFARDWEYSHVLLELDRLMETQDIRRVLDVGGGNSPFAYHLLERGLEVVVLEVDGNMVEEMRRNAADLGLSLRAERPGPGGWPVEDESFDCVTSISVFESVLRRDRPGMWAETRRVLTPGGSLLMTFDYGPGARLISDPPVDLAEVHRDLVEASGMKLVGAPHPAPDFGTHGPPVKAVVPTVDGWDFQVAEYSFAAIHLRRP